MLSLSFAWKFQGMPLIIYLMRKINLILPILGLLLSFVTMAADNSITNEHGRINLEGKTYTARIITPKAIVYADENMLSPLGYIANGKAIIVGNPRRMNRDLVPLVVYGRLAFIEIKDIRYEDTADEGPTGDLDSRCHCRRQAQTASATASRIVATPSGT